MTVEHIGAPALAALLERETRRAAPAGVCYIRDAEAFQSHLVSVACRAQSVARRLLDVLPPEEAPDPVAAFIAGAWHDAGKIWHGDDYHELTSAIALLDHGVEWGLAQGPTREVTAILDRAARAIIPHFAIYEQWQPDYVPSGGRRDAVEPTYRRLAQLLCQSTAQAEQQRELLLPTTVDALVVMYSDMAPALGGDDTFAVAFERRWRDVEQRASSDDPAILTILPVVRPRLFDGCALVDCFLAHGYDADALERFRAAYNPSDLSCRVRRDHHLVWQSSTMPFSI